VIRLLPIRVGRAWWGSRPARWASAVVVLLLWFEHSSNQGLGVLMVLAVIGVGVAWWRRRSGKVGGGDLVRRLWREQPWRMSQG